MRAATVGTLVGALIVAVLLASSALGRVVVCDAYGWPITGLDGGEAEYIDPPPLSLEVSPNCFEVPWWASRSSVFTV